MDMLDNQRAEDDFLEGEAHERVLELEEENQELRDLIKLMDSTLRTLVDALPEVGDGT